MRKHRQCAWCGRLKHQDGSAHGRPFNPKVLANIGYSHGACSACKSQLLASRQRSPSL